MDVSGAIAAFFYIMGGSGLFLTGVGVLWFVTVCIEKKKQRHRHEGRFD
jgi:hypothetical protein